MSITVLSPGAKAQPATLKYDRFLLWRRAWNRYRKNKLALFGLVFSVAVILVAIFASVLAPFPYDKIDPINALQGPSAKHWLGTDILGRDMLSRIIYGAQPMLLVGIISGLVGLVIGVPLGILSGYVGGIFDLLITRLIDLFSALPWYLIALYLVMVLSPSLENLIIALTITSWVGSCRLVRGMTLSLRERDYITASQALGMSTTQVLTRHILPQVSPLLLWGFASGIPTSVFAEAGLSFIGLGIRPPSPSWGRMLGEAGTYWQYFPHMFLVPGGAIILSVLAFQGMADGLRDALDVNK